MQRLLLRSTSAKLLAVRRVTQDNQGKNTPGVDGVTVILQHFRFSLVPGATIDARVNWTMLNPASGMPMRLLPLEARFASVPVNGSVHDLVDLGAAREAAPSRAA